MTDLTKRQLQILTEIAKRISETGQQPTIRQLCQRFKIASPNGVQCHLRALQTKGVIKKPNKHCCGFSFPNWREYT